MPLLLPGGEAVGGDTPPHVVAAEIDGAAGDQRAALLRDHDQCVLAQVVHDLAGPHQGGRRLLVAQAVTVRARAALEHLSVTPGVLSFRPRHDAVLADSGRQLTRRVDVLDCGIAAPGRGLVPSALAILAPLPNELPDALIDQV